MGERSDFTIAHFDDLQLPVVMTRTTSHKQLKNWLWSLLVTTLEFGLSMICSINAPIPRKRAKTPLIAIIGLFVIQALATIIGDLSEPYMSLINSCLPYPVGARGPVPAERDKSDSKIKNSAVTEDVQDIIGLVQDVLINEVVPVVEMRSHEGRVGMQHGQRTFEQDGEHGL